VKSDAPETRERTARAARDAPLLARTTKTVLWGLAFYAAAQLAGSFLAKNAVAAAAVQAAIAEWGAGRIGIAWSDPSEASSAWRDLASRAGRGAGLGLGVGALVVVFVLSTRAATLAPNAPLVGQLVVGLLAAVLVSVRDELLLRGVVLHALDGVASVPLRLVACAGAAAAASFGAGRADPLELAIAALTGAVLGAVWLFDRGAWMAVGAHTAWSWTTGTLVRGGLLDLRARAGVWGGGDAGLQGSAAVACALAVVTIVAVVALTRARAGRAAIA
jgi:membrane protease YdiL (CAAX protease family)